MLGEWGRGKKGTREGGGQTRERAEGGEEERRIWPALVLAVVLDSGGSAASESSSGFSSFELMRPTPDPELVTPQCRKTRYALVKRGIHDLEDEPHICSRRCWWSFWLLRQPEWFWSGTTEATVFLVVVETC